MKRHQELLETLLRQKAGHDWQACGESLFRLLHGLPAGTQLGLARFACGRYLPSFQRQWPACRWPGELLADVDGWLARHGRGLPEEPADPDPGAAAFVLALDGLLLAAKHPDDPLVLTSSCGAAVISAISARQCAVWMADDPEGVEMWQSQGYFPGRSVAESRPALAVAEREWEAVAAWLEQAKVWTQARAVAPEEIDKGLARWKDHELLPMVPGKRP